MNHLFTINNDCFEVFLSDSSSYENDELLAKALNFMINSGLNVSFKGFDKYKRAIIEINGIIHTVAKGDTIGLRQRFICAKHHITIEEDFERCSNIVKLLV